MNWLSQSGPPFKIPWHENQTCNGYKSKPGKEKNRPAVNKLGVFFKTFLFSIREDVKWPLEIYE